MSGTWTPGPGRTPDDDVFSGSDAAETVDAGPGNDSLFGEGGDDSLAGGRGNDSLAGGIDDDHLDDGIGRDTLSGGSGDDSLFGGDGDDRLVGGSGSNLLSGGLGADTVMVDFPGDGADLIDLGADSDVVVVSSPGAGTAPQIRLTVTLAEIGDGRATDSNVLPGQDGGLAVRMQLEDGNGNAVGPISRFDDEGITFLSQTQGVTFDVRDLDSGAAVVAGFTSVTFGTASADTLTGATSGYLHAGLGDDVLYGGNARGSVLQGGDGNDRIVAGHDGDVLQGGAGDDSLVAGWYRQVLEGGDGNDVLFGRAGRDLIVGGAGNDVLWGNPGQDTLDGGHGSDTMIGAYGRDRFLLTPGAPGDLDSILKFESNDVLVVSAASLGNGITRREYLDGTERFAATAGGVATQPYAQFVYDTDSGLLTFDPDGTGGGAAQAMVVLFRAPVLDASDLRVVA